VVLRSERNDFIFNSFRNFKLVKRFQNRSDVLECWCLDNSSSKSILGVLETIYLIFWKTVVQRVAVVKLGVYDGGGNCFGGVKVKVGTDRLKFHLARLDSTRLDTFDVSSPCILAVSS